VVSIDGTLIFQIILFLALLTVLNHLIYKPILAKFQDRRKKIEDSEETAASLNKEDADLHQEIKSKLISARSLADKKAQNAIEDVDKLTRQEFEKSRQEHDQFLNSHRQETEQQTQSAKADLSPYIQEMTKAFMKKILPVLMIVALSCFPVMASSGSQTHETDAHHEEDAEHGGMSETARIVDFLVMFVILLFLLKKPIANAFRNRTESIRNSLENSEKSVDLANEKLKTSRVRFSEIEQESEQIIKDADTHVEELRKRLLKEGEIKAEKMHSDAENQIKNITKSARDDVRQNIITSSLTNVESQISKGVDKDIDRRLVSECLERLSVFQIGTGGESRA